MPIGSQSPQGGAFKQPMCQNNLIFGQSAFLAGSKLFRWLPAGQSIFENGSNDNLAGKGRFIRWKRGAASFTGLPSAFLLIGSEDGARAKGT